MKHSHPADKFGIALDTEKVKRLRESLELSMEEAARRAGLRGGRQRWYKIETGIVRNITLEMLDGISVALKCKARDLLK